VALLPGAFHTDSVRGKPEMLVGRRAELAWLRQRLQLAARGAPQCVLVSGPTGIGKTRLTFELLEHAQSAGFLTLVGRGYDDVAVPFLAFREHIFPEFVRLLDDGAGPPAALGVAGGEDSEAYAQSWDQVASTKLLLELTDVVIEAAARRPLVLFLDDVHWADSGSLALVHHLVYRLAGGLPQTPLLLMLAARPVPEIAALRREPRCAVIELTGLDALETTDLGRRLGATHMSRQRIWEQTKGNPLLIESVAHEVASGDGVAPPVVLDAEAMFNARVQSLSPTCTEVAQMAAVLVPDLSVGALVALGQWDEPTVVAALDEAALAGVLANDAHDLRFAHPLALKCCLARMGPMARSRAHAAVARVLGPPEGAALLGVARHLVLAGHEADPDEVDALATAAGRQASQLCAWEEAADFFEAALAIQDRRPVPATPVERAALHLAAGKCHQFAMHSDGGRAHFERASALSHGAGDLIGEAHAENDRLVCLVAAGSVRRRDFGLVETLAEQVETTDPHLAAEILTDVSQAQWVTGRIADARSTIDRVLAIAEPREFYGTAGKACVSRAITNWFTLDLRGALGDLRQADSYVRRGADRTRQIGPAYRLPLTLLWLGRLGEVRAAVERATAVSAEVGSLYEFGLVIAASGALALMNGEVTAAEEDADRVLRLQDLSGYRWAAALLLPALALAHLNRGDVEGASEALSTWEVDADDLSRSVSIALMRSAVAVRAGRAGREVLHRLPAIPSEPVLGAQDLAALTVDIARSLDEPEIARDAVALLEATIERGMIVSSTLAVMLTRVAGDGHALLGNVDAARRRYTEAMQLADNSGARTEAAFARLGLARLEAQHDRAVAITMLRGALPLLEQLSLQPALVEATALAQHLGLRTVPSGAHSDVPVSETTTVMFLDVVDSTRLTEALGNVEYRERARSLERRLRLVVAENNGMAMPGINLGDGLVALFPSPRDAVLAGFGAVRAAQGDVLRLHVGLHHGTVLREGDATYGAAVNVAARVCALSSPDEVLITEELWRLLSDKEQNRVAFVDRGIYVLKGVAAPRRVFAALQTT
jgi:class 3 adenylate cyclase